MRVRLTVEPEEAWRKRLARVTFVRVENIGSEEAADDPGTVLRGPDHPGTSIPQYLEYTPEYFVGRKVARMREQRGWSQSVLGEKLARHGFELHQTTIAKLEAGKRPIRVNEVVALADVFSVPVLDLLPDEVGMIVNQDELAMLAREIQHAQAELAEAEDRVRLITDAIEDAQAQRERAVHRHAELQSRLAELHERFRLRG